MHRSSRRARRHLVLATLAILAAAPAAQASTVSLSGTTITIVGGDESSDISFPGGGHYWVDDMAGATAGDGCSQVTATRVDCGTPTQYSLSAVVADLGAGDDRYLYVGSYTQTVDGGPGDDHIDTGALDDVVHGGPGNDFVDGGPGHDQVYGDEGDDEVRGGDNSDDVYGGPGRDVINGDGDNVTDDGSDRIFARDGEADQIDCGFGADVVEADNLDVADSTQCERVDVQRVSPAKPGLAVSTKRSRPVASVTKKPGYPIGIVAANDGMLRVQLVIPASAARRFGLGRHAFLVGAVKGAVKADSYAVGLWASGAKARRLLALRRRPGFTSIPAVIVAKLTSGGATTTRSIPVKLRR